MDYQLYHLVNAFVQQHAWLGRGVGVFESWAVPAFALATVGLWLLARPGSSAHWKPACVAALGSAAVALLVNQLIAAVWARPRPFTAHPDAAVWGARSHDPSFPSDHASAAFAIAVAVLLYDRVAGSLFLAAAVAVAVGRVAVGLHYPSDVAAGALVGVAAAFLVGRLGAPAVARVVLIAERLTDPVLRPAWRLVGGSRRSAGA